MFHIRVGHASVVYTGDYNMTPDRHLGAAWIDKVRPDVLITESTYATTIRDSKRARERDFLKKVHECVAQNGKVGPGTRPCLWGFFFSLRMLTCLPWRATSNQVLIPVFALGRAQELCILLDTYWERMNLKVPIYFSAGPWRWYAGREAGSAVCSRRVRVHLARPQGSPRKPTTTTSCSSTGRTKRLKRRL